MIHLMMIMEVMNVHDDDGVDTVPDDDDGDNAAPTPKIDNKQYNLIMNNGGE